MRFSGRSYLRKRAMELASPTTRALTDPLAEWALQKIRLEGKPFTFAGHLYLKGIYDDTSPHVVLSKAAQIGGTTYGILRSFHACLQGLNVIYFFPTRTDVIEFSKSRVGPLLHDNPFLARRMTDTDTAGLKRIGDAHLHFRGMQSSVGMKSVPADMIVFDELDEATPDARTLAWERIAHSDYKRIIELSNPSLPNYGIDEQYEKSDQRHWTLKCPACGAWTALDREFPMKLGEEVRIILPRPDGTWFRACVKCGHGLDLDQGEWVADFPDRLIHGYRVSQLFSSKVDPGEILAEYRTTRFPERFYNLKIGVPWADLEHRLDVASVLSCVGDIPEKVKDKSVYMGVDTGKAHHVVILRGRLGEKQPLQVIHLTVCQTFEDLDALMKQFSVAKSVIDMFPETHATRAFAERHRGHVFMCYFNENQRGSAKWSHEDHTVQVNRTEALDASRAIVREKKVVISRGVPHLEQFAKHMASDAKILDEDLETGVKKYRYVKTGENHFSLAFTYATMALSEPVRHALIAVSYRDDPAPLWRGRSGAYGWIGGGFGMDDVSDEELYRRLMRGRAEVDQAADEEDEVDA